MNQSHFGCFTLLLLGENFVATGILFGKYDGIFYLGIFSEVWARVLDCLSDGSLLKNLPRDYLFSILLL